MTAVQIFLDSKRAKQFDGRHPWVMQHAVVEPTVPVSPGQTVELMNINGSWIGRAIYNPNSRLRIRLYQWKPDAPLEIRGEFTNTPVGPGHLLMIRAE